MFYRVYFESVVGQWYSNSKEIDYLFQRYEAMENEVDKYRG